MLITHTELVSCSVGKRCFWERIDEGILGTLLLLLSSELLVSDSILHLYLYLYQQLLLDKSLSSPLESFPQLFFRSRKKEDIFDNCRLCEQNFLSTSKVSLPPSMSISSHLLPRHINWPVFPYFCNVAHIICAIMYLRGRKLLPYFRISRLMPPR